MLWYRGVLVLMVVLGLGGLYLRTQAYKISATAIVALLVVACPLIGLNIRHTIEEHRYADIARELTATTTGEANYANNTATVNCQAPFEGLLSPSSSAGYVEFPDDGKPRVMTLQTDTCKALRGYRNGGHEDPTTEQMVAVHVLTHESMHLAGEVTERYAECMAVQRNYDTARALGASKDDAISLARTYFDKRYHKQPDEYQDDECKRDGALDEHLPNPPWPIEKDKT